MIPGVRFEASECNCLENSESTPRAGCTDSTTSLDAYAILATITPRINQPWTLQRLLKQGQSGASEYIPASPTVAVEAMRMDSNGFREQKENWKQLKKKKKRVAMSCKNCKWCKMINDGNNGSSVTVL